MFFQRSSSEAHFTEPVLCNTNEHIESAFGPSLGICTFGLLAATMVQVAWDTDVFGLGLRTSLGISWYFG